MNPFHPAAAAFPQPTAHTAESLSAAVAAKTEHIAAAHKQDASGGGQPNQIPGSQVSEKKTFYFYWNLLFIQQLCAVACCMDSRIIFMNIQVVGLGRFMADENWDILNLVCSC